jgi:hypothetical protein
VGRGKEERSLSGITTHDANTSKTTHSLGFQLGTILILLLWEHVWKHFFGYYLWKGVATDIQWVGDTAKHPTMHRTTGYNKE